MTAKKKAVVFVAAVCLSSAWGNEVVKKPERAYSDEEYDRLGRLLARTTAIDPKKLSQKLKRPLPKVEPPRQQHPENRNVAVDATGDAAVVDTVNPLAQYVEPAVEVLASAARKRLDKLLEGTESASCREMVTARFAEIYTRLLEEDFLPFEREQFHSECPTKALDSEVLRLEPSKIRLAYLLLVHEAPEQIIRLINALTEEPWRHSFVVHVDGKKESDATFETLSKYAETRDRVALCTTRANVSWGGFNVVRATIFGLETVLNTFDGEFDWIATLSGYTYPLVSNKRIRETLAEFPANTEFMEIRPQPNEPQSRAWHQFIECDNAMRRIYRLVAPENVKMYMGSQWMIVTRDLARYVVGDARRATNRRRAYVMSQTYSGSSLLPSDAKPEPPAVTFAEQYERYAAYTMVADENFFVTVLKNSPLCHNHQNDNFLHVQFDKWENEKVEASANKCLQPNPRHCGRSPTTLTLDYLPVLELGGAMFARKFAAPVVPEGIENDPARKVLDAIDAKRRREEVDGYEAPAPPVFDPVRIAWRPHHLSGAPKTELCVAVLLNDDDASSKSSSSKRLARDVALKPCDANDMTQRFALGPCSTDGAIELFGDKTPLAARNETEETSVVPAAVRRAAAVTPGEFAPAPFCPIVSAVTTTTTTSAKSHSTAGSSPPRRLCLDLEREHITPGTTIIAYACTGRWNQLFALGTGLNGKPATGAVYVDVPYPYHVPKELCLEAVLASSSSDTNQRHHARGHRPALKVNVCDGAKLEQLFHVEYAPQKMPVRVSPALETAATTEQPMTASKEAGEDTPPQNTSRDDGDDAAS